MATSPPAASEKQNQGYPAGPTAIEILSVAVGPPSVPRACDPRVRLGAIPHPDAEVELWAALLHTFVDGLASQIINTPREVSADAAARLLRSLLQAVPSGC
ncbi:hypothetical protein [Micromonospora sp. NPDC005173]|uniref:hypothetical protein n=1 Tax=Micromonospora sp. NPDC005173 TaxID=3157165 RepID=UPI00339F2A32